MARIVMKFGGTSVADLDRIRHVATLVKRQLEFGDEVEQLHRLFVGRQESGNPLALTDERPVGRV